MSYATINLADWEDFQQTFPDAAAAIEREFMDATGWKYVNEIAAQYRDADALVSLARHLSNAWRQYRDERASEHMVREQKYGNRR